MKKILFATILYCTNCIAQISLPTDIPTPNATDLGKYGEFPVSYYTGRANISIPLFSTTVKGMPLNMTLDYDTSGILFNSMPGWTGQNWTLNVGGVITRCVENRQDELEYPACGEHYLNQRGERVNITDMPCYFKNHNKLPIWINNENVLKDSIGSLCGDLSPDIFNFNFMGKTGKFFLGNDGEWKVLCDENIDILFDINDEQNYIPPFIRDYPAAALVDYQQPKTIRGFVIRDSEGNSYYFGYYKDTNGVNYDNWYPIDYSISFFGISEKEKRESWNANSWYLTEVRDKNDNLLYQFLYERGKFIPQIFVSWGFMDVTEGYNMEYSSTLSPLDFIKGLNSFHGYAEYYRGNTGAPLSGSLQSPVYLKRIKCQHGVWIDFTRDFWGKSGNELYPGLQGFWRSQYDTEFEGGTVAQTPYYYLQTNNSLVREYQYWGYNDNIDRRETPLASTRFCNLTDIRIYNNYNNTGSEHWRFLYDDSNRKMLLSLKKVSTFQQQIIDYLGKYEFEYNDFSELPNDYLVTAVDHYGHYNGREYLTVCLENFHTNINPFTDIIKECREPDENCAKMGMLKKIKYPTGGYTSIEYEANKFDSYVNQNRTSMVSCENSQITGGLRVKSLSDCEGADTLRKKTFIYESGELYAMPKYTWANWSPSQINDNSNYTSSVVFTTAVFPLTNSFGPHIGYSKVTEKNMDGSYKVYRYSNISSAPAEPAFIQINRNSPYDRFSEHDYKRGRLLSTTYYSNEGLLTKKENYDYIEDDNEKYVLTSNMIFNMFWTGCSFFTGGIYKLYYPKYDITHRIDSIYNNNSAPEIREVYYSNSSRHIHLDYPYSHYADVRLLNSEFHFSSSENSITSYAYPITDIQDSLYKKHFVLYPNIKEQYKNGILMQKENTVFKRWNNGIFAPERITITRNNHTKDLVHFLSYSDTGALTSYAKDGVLVNLEWSYFDGGIKRMTEGGKLVTSYTYSPFWQIKTKTLPNGYTNYFTYDISGRLSAIEEIGTNNSRVKLKDFKYSIIND